MVRGGDQAVSVGGQVDNARRVTPGPAATQSAPAKLTLSLRVKGLRPDGMHELVSEMVSIDLADTLTFSEGSGLTVIDGVVGDLGLEALTEENLVEKALAVCGSTAAVRLTKRIPVGAGLGGGSTDAAAVLRWAGVTDPVVASGLGSDVTFCLAGGRARVSGIGESIEPLPFEDRRFVLLLPPIAVDTGSVYRAWDYLGRTGRLAPEEGDAGNDLEQAALSVYPQLLYWREMFADVTRSRPRLAGSGSTWYVEGSPDDLDLRNRSSLVLGSARAPIVPVRTTRASYEPAVAPSVPSPNPEHR
jgi:4-diphosphocytidyl-2-C-methyl-D-erythritol kinase